MKIKHYSLSRFLIAAMAFAWSFGVVLPRDQQDEPVEQAVDVSSKPQQKKEPTAEEIKAREDLIKMALHYAERTCGFREVIMLDNPATAENKEECIKDFEKLSRKILGKYRAEVPAADLIRSRQIIQVALEQHGYTIEDARAFFKHVKAQEATAELVDLAETMLGGFFLGLSETLFDMHPQDLKMSEYGGLGQKVRYLGVLLSQLPIVNLIFGGSYLSTSGTIEQHKEYWLGRLAQFGMMIAFVPIYRRTVMQPKIDQMKEQVGPMADLFIDGAGDLAPEAMRNLVPKGMSGMSFLMYALSTAVLQINPEERQNICLTGFSRHFGSYTGYFLYQFAFRMVPALIYGMWAQKTLNVFGKDALTSMVHDKHNLWNSSVSHMVNQASSIGGGVIANKLTGFQKKHLPQNMVTDVLELGKIGRFIGRVTSGSAKRVSAFHQHRDTKTELQKYVDLQNKWHVDSGFYATDAHKTKADTLNRCWGGSVVSDDDFKKFEEKSGADRFAQLAEWKSNKNKMYVPNIDGITDRRELYRILGKDFVASDLSVIDANWASARNVNPANDEMDVLLPYWKKEGAQFVAKESIVFLLTLALYASDKGLVKVFSACKYLARGFAHAFKLKEETRQEWIQLWQTMQLATKMLIVGYLILKPLIDSADMVNIATNMEKLFGVFIDIGRDNKFLEDKARQGALKVHKIFADNLYDYVIEDMLSVYAKDIPYVGKSVDEYFCDDEKDQSAELQKKLDTAGLSLTEEEVIKKQMSGLSSHNSSWGNFGRFAVMSSLWAFVISSLRSEGGLAEFKALMSGDDSGKQSDANLFGDLLGGSDADMSTEAQEALTQDQEALKEISEEEHSSEYDSENEDELDEEVFA